MTSAGFALAKSRRPLAASTGSPVTKAMADGPARWASTPSTPASLAAMEVSVFFTFWGLFALVKPDRRRKTGKDWMTKALGQMNPGSTAKAKLSRYNFGGMGPWMLGKVAEDYKTPHPTELLELARDMGVRLIPCQMTMDLMGIGTEDLMEGLEEPIGAATALLEMKESAIQLFI